MNDWNPVCPKSLSSCRVLEYTDDIFHCSCGYIQYAPLPDLNKVRERVKKIAREEIRTLNCKLCGAEITVPLTSKRQHCPVCVKARQSLGNGGRLQARERRRAALTRP
jgi:hypothetical protein